MTTSLAELTLHASEQEHGRGDDPSSLHRRLDRYKDLVETLTQRLKTGESTNSKLREEMQVLKTMLESEHSESTKLKGKMKKMFKAYGKFERMKEEYTVMEQYVREHQVKRTTSANIGTSSTDLINVRNKTTQVVESEVDWDTLLPRSSEPSVRLTKTELGRLEADMSALRAILAQREESWTKMTSREADHRLRILKLSGELQNLRQVANHRKEELDAKSKALQDMSVQCQKSNEAIIRLKRYIMKLEREKDGTWKEAPSTKEQVQRTPTASRRLQCPETPKANKKKKIKVSQTSNLQNFSDISVIESMLGAL